MNIYSKGTEFDKANKKLIDRIDSLNDLLYSAYELEQIELSKDKLKELIIELHDIKTQLNNEYTRIYDNLSLSSSKEAKRFACELSILLDEVDRCLSLTSYGDWRLYSDTLEEIRNER
jgi:hypothetical protein